MNSKTQLQATLERMKAGQRKPKDWLACTVAADEIAQALSLPWEPALVLLHGLCATGLVRCLNRQREIVDPDEVTLAEFQFEAVIVNATDVREQLAEWTA